MKQDISENNLFYISFDTNKNINIKELEGKDSNYNRARQPTNSLTIDDIIVNLKKKKLRFDDLKDINFVGSEPRIDGMNYTDEFKESLNTIKKRQLLKEIYIEEEKPFTPQMLHKELKEIYTTILNILITVVSSIVACWYWTPYMDINLRVLLCLFVGILVLVADVVVYNSFRRNTD
ncbi:Vacuolar ATPase assembly integral membrane protein HuVPH2 [Hanseniaspora uvarum DSM 2768]|nr:Vacuolar ATPase assembly integral membrane protein HuVPH2 [Hanseniaspora uvarum DSM 2768]